MFVFKLKRKFAFEQIYMLLTLINDNLHWQYFHEQKARNLGFSRILAIFSLYFQRPKPKAES